MYVQRQEVAGKASVIGFGEAARDAWNLTHISNYNLFFFWKLLYLGTMSTEMHRKA